MKKTVFLYNEKDNTFRFRIGNLTTAKCLANFNAESEISISDFGATLYKKYGWATEKDIPKMQTIKEVVYFFKSEGDIGLIEFGALIDGVGIINSKDDNECDITFKKKHTCFEFIKKAVPSQYQNLIIYNLTKNQNIYIMRPKWQYI